MNLSKLTLSQWLEYLESNSDFDILLDLKNIHAVASRLDLLNPQATVITVAGTNGKGSTVAALEAIYVEAGYKVGVYTSPHLLVHNERIRIQGRLITDEALCEAFLAIEIGRGDTPLSYFELSTLAALWEFKKLALDVVILEVGMGGRLDATNIVDADLAIITTIDLDHQAILGATKEAIGYEKAGILRKNQLFLYADPTPPPQTVLQQAKAIQAVQLPCIFKTTPSQLQVFLPEKTITLPLPTIHPQAAAAAVVASAGLSAFFPLTEQHWQKALEKVRIAGRQQVVKGAVTTIYDVAHNPQSVRLLAEFLKHFPRPGKVHAVFSGLKDKDLCGLIEPMQDHVNFWYPALLTGKRAASESLLLTSFPPEVGVTGCYDNPWEAYQAAQARAELGDVIVVYGSFLTVGEVLAHSPNARGE